MERVHKYSEQEFVELIRKWQPIVLPQVQEGNHGKYVVIDLDTGEYEVDADPVKACHRLRDRIPNAEGFLDRIGYPGGVKLGGKGFKVIR